MRQRLVSLLACPEDGGALAGWDGCSEEAELSCVGCGRRFPVKGGIAQLLPDAMRESADREFEEKRQEMKARDEQVGMYDRNLPLRLLSIPEIPLTMRFVAPKADSIMLEAGCGTGRMTPRFANAVAGLVCADISAESLRVARGKLSPAQLSKTIFVQSDLCHIPLQSGSFDRVGSFQVLEHIPTPQARAEAISEMARVLKPGSDGGRLALSAYRWGPPLSWIAQKEGHHEGGIYFYRSTWDELRALVEPNMKVGGRTSAILYHFLIWATKP
jgi:SAM-dependent methyltransferase